MINTKSRIFRFIVGLDQAFNPLVYGGSEDVTISSQTAYNELLLHKDHKKRVMIDWIFRKFFGEPQHCYYSLFSEMHCFENAALIQAVLADLGIDHEDS